MTFDTTLGTMDYHIVNGTITLSGNYMKRMVDRNYHVDVEETGIRIDGRLFTFPADTDASALISENPQTLIAWKLLRAYAKAFHALLVPNLDNVVFTVAQQRVEVTVNTTITQPTQHDAER